MTVMSSAALPLPAVLGGNTSLRLDFAWTLAGNLVYAGCQWGMVMALAKLSEKEIIHLDEERKAAMVSNLLVVLCSEQATQQVINTGSLYQ